MNPPASPPIKQAALFRGCSGAALPTLGGNTALVDAILVAQKTSGVQRTEQTKAQMLQTIGMLARRATGQPLPGQVLEMAASRREFRRRNTEFDSPQKEHPSLVG